VAIVLGGSCPGGSCPGGSCPVAVVRVAIVQVAVVRIPEKCIERAPLAQGLWLRSAIVQHVTPAT